MQGIVAKANRRSETDRGDKSSANALGPDLDPSEHNSIFIAELLHIIRPISHRSYTFFKLDWYMTWTCMINDVAVMGLDALSVVHPAVLWKIVDPIHCSTRHWHSQVGYFITFYSCGVQFRCKHVFVSSCGLACCWPETALPIWARRSVKRWGGEPSSFYTTSFAARSMKLALGA